MYKLYKYNLQCTHWGKNYTTPKERTDALKDIDSPSKVKTVLNMQSIDEKSITDISKNIVLVNQRANVFELSFEEYQHEINKLIETSKSFCLGESPKYGEDQKWFLGIFVSLLDEKSKIKELLLASVENVAPDCEPFFYSLNRVKNASSMQEYLGLFKEEYLKDFYFVISLESLIKEFELSSYIAGDLRNLLLDLIPNPVVNHLNN